MPAVRIQDASVNISPEDILISIHGNFVAMIINIVKSLFLGVIRDQIQDNIRRALMNDLQDALNKLVADQQGISELYPGIEVDWTITESPVINS